MDNKQEILQCIDLFNQCTLKWVDVFYSDELEWTELPKAGTPDGRRGNLTYFRECAVQLLTLFPDRQLKVLRSVAEDDTVVLEQEWQGTASFSAGNFVAGNVARQRIVSFFTLKNGRIVQETDYCSASI